MTADGPLQLDLDLNPHLIIAGAPGAGKSELLLSLVTSLAALYPPERVSFLLVDCKGGSAFEQCAPLPHTVGVVTELKDPWLIRRALASLNAEMKRRSGPLARAGGSIRQMERDDPSSAPPRLLIIFDEFAKLLREMPPEELNTAVDDIAARGRTLGMHLVIATQSPGGVVTGKIKANVGLRIALRVSDRSESEEVIGGPAAAAIPVLLSGRAIARTAPGQFTEFQSAYASNESAVSEADGEVVVVEFGFGDTGPAGDRTH